MTISKLLVELENTHGDASLVSRSSSGLLNRVERLSATCEMITNNLGEENLPLKRERQDSQEVPVYVLNMRGQPLMPTPLCKARIVLKEKKKEYCRNSSQRYINWASLRRKL